MGRGQSPPSRKLAISWLVPICRNTGTKADRIIGPPAFLSVDLEMTKAIETDSIGSRSSEDGQHPAWKPRWQIYFLNLRRSVLVFTPAMSPTMCAGRPVQYSWLITWRDRRPTNHVFF